MKESLEHRLLKDTENRSNTRAILLMNDESEIWIPSFLGNQIRYLIHSLNDKDIKAVFFGYRSSISGISKLRNSLIGYRLLYAFGLDYLKVREELLAKLSSEEKTFSVVLGSPKTELEWLLQNHDWTYGFSDDHRVWLSGDKELKKIQSYQNKMQPSEFVELWEKYAPFDYNKNIPWL